jgi:MFS family permease
MTEQRLFSSPWWIVFGSAMALVVGNAPIGLFSFGLFIKPMSAEFGWDRSTISAANGVGTIISAIAVPFVGMMMDRWGIRRVLLPFLVAYAVSIALVSLTPASPWVFVALFTLVGLVGAGQGPLAYVKSVSGWFDEQRGLALGIALTGVGIGTALVPQYAQYLINVVGWRYGFVGLGLLVFVIAVPSVLLFVREPTDALVSRQGLSLGNAEEGPSEVILPGLSVREALTGSARFWHIATAVLLVSIVTNGSLIHMVPLLTDSGMSATVAASMMIAAGLSTIAGRLLSGFLFDRFFAPYVAAFFFLLPCAGLYLLASGKAPVLGIISVGLCAGTEIDMIGYLTSRYFGLKRFGQLYGYMFAVFAIGAALGSFVMGACFDRFQSYDVALTGFSVLLAFASALVVRLGPYAFPVIKKANAPVPDQATLLKPANAIIQMTTKR